MAEIELTESQRRAVEFDGNVVVSAGAGSGKTKVLSLRFARLVEGGTDERGTDADRILVLTFTNKAAVEMKGRIFSQLSADKEKGSKLAEKALSNFDKTHIQTLDSYFSELVRTGAHFYGITPSFRIDDERISSLVKNRAMQFVLSRSGNFAIRRLSRDSGFSKIAEEIFMEAVLYHSAVISDRTFSLDFQRQKVAVEEFWRENAEKADVQISKMIGEISGIGSKKIGKTEEKLLEAAKRPQVFNPFEGGGIWERDAVRKIEEYCSYINGWVSLQRLSFPKDDEKKPELFRIGLLFEVLKDFSNALFFASDFVANAEISGEVARLLDEFDAQIRNEKRREGILTFADISALARDILETRSEIRHLEQQKFDKIMIDEFQDNDQRQCDILFMLADENEKFDKDGKYIVPNFDANSENYVQRRLNPKKLFFVGDEKQSIYRFRNADVTVFRNLIRHLRGERFDDGNNFIYLDTNFRSKPNLVESFNEIFGGRNEAGRASVLMKREDGTEIPQYEAEYLNVKFDPKKLPDENPVRAHFALYRKEGGSDEDEENYAVEGKFVARKILELTRPLEGGSPKYRYSDIALLFRTTSQFEAYENELLKAHIPYTTEVFKGFFADGPVNDISAFLRLSVYPEDMNSLSKVLCSPFVGIAREEMQVLSAALREKNSAMREEARANPENRELLWFVPPFSQEFSDLAREVFGPESSVFKKIEFARSGFEKIARKLNTESISEIVTDLWYEFGYRYETLWNTDVKMFQNLYDILYELSRKADSNSMSVAGFLDELESYNNSTSKIEGLDVPLQNDDSVKILTIHKSKGLEYPVVFVCAANAAMKSRSELVEDGKEFGLTVKVPRWRFIDSLKFFEKNKWCDSSGFKNPNIIRKIEKIQSEKEDAAELRRLNYVACTRAIDELFVVGSTQAKPFSAGFPEKPRTILQSMENVLALGTETEKTESPETPGEEIETVVGKEGFTFDYESIDLEELKSSANFVQSKKFTENTEAEKVGFARRMTPLYEEMAAEKREYVLPSHVSPSALETADFAQNDDAPFPEIDDLVILSVPLGENFLKALKAHDEAHPKNPFGLLSDEGDAAERRKFFGRIEKFNKVAPEVEKIQIPRPMFGYNDFGTAAHAILEQKIDSVAGNSEFTPVLPQKAVSGLLFGTKKEQEQKLETVLNACLEMVEEFSGTEIFGEICASGWKKSEYPFRLNFSGSILSGTMDLVFRNPEGAKFKYTILDYKTDRAKCPIKYFAQLSAYRMALSSITGVDAGEIRCVLQYLRYGSGGIEDITSECTEGWLSERLSAFLEEDRSRFGA